MVIDLITGWKTYNHYALTATHKQAPIVEEIKRKFKKFFYLIYRISITHHLSLQGNPFSKTLNIFFIPQNRSIPYTLNQKF